MTCSKKVQKGCRYLQCRKQAHGEVRWDQVGPIDVELGQEVLRRVEELFKRVK